MKQSNSAIKYLLAHYRSIFKHAYFKGLVSAVALTAGLAAGQAQAATPYNIDALSGKDPITVDSETNKLSGSVTTDSAWTVDVTINSGEVSTSVNQIDNASAGGDFTLSGNGTLTLKAQSGNGIIFATEAAHKLTVDISQIDVQSGELQLSAGTGSGGLTLAANTINIGGQGPNDNDATAILKIDASSTATSGTVTLGRTAADNVSGSVITVKNGGLLNISGTGTYGSKVVGDSLSITNGGVLLTSGGKVSLDSKLTEVANGGYWIVSGDTTATSHETNINGGLLVSGGDLTITAASTTYEGTTDIDEVGSLTLKSGSTLELHNGITVTKGVLNVESGAGLHAAVEADDNSSGTIFVSGQASLDKDMPSLRISSTDLKKFLDGGNEYQKITYTPAKGTIDRDTSVDSVKGSLVLTSGARLLLTDEKVDLTTALNFASQNADNTNGQAGLIVLTESGDPGIISGSNITISGRLRSSQETPNDVSDKLNLNIEADNLTLGSTGFDSSKKALGFDTATAKNVKFIGSGSNNFFLQDDLVLRSTRKISGSGVVGENGLIEGDVTISGGSVVTVDGGKYSSNDSFVIDGGSLLVDNSKQANVSSLTLSGLDIDLTNGSATITANGQLSDSYDPNNTRLDKLTQLDLSKGFEVSGTANKATFTAESGAIIIFDAGDMNDVFAAVTSGSNVPDSNVVFAAHSGGKLVTDGDLTIEYKTGGIDYIKKQVAMLDLSSGGILEANSLHVKFGLDQAGGFNGGEIRVKDMTFEKTSAGDTLKVGDSNYLISNSFTLKGANLTLGQPEDFKHDLNITFSTESASGSGSINIDSGKTVTLDAGYGYEVNVAVEQGNWTASQGSFVLQSGTMTVGGDDTVASLTALDLKATGTAGKFEVNSGSSATFTTFEQTDGTINVSGALTISGKHTESGADTSESWGVKTTGGAINVAGNNAVLEFGSDAVGNISLSGDKIVYANSGDTFANNITLSSFGTLKLGFTDMSFTVEGLKNLRREFISGSNGEVLTSGFIDLGDAKITGIDLDTSNGTISWDALGQVSDIADIKTDGLSSATLIDVDSSDYVTANVGNIKATGSTDKVNIGQTTLNQANKDGYFAVNENGELVDLNVIADGHLIVYNGGKLAGVNLTEGPETYFSIVSSGDAVTSVQSISGGSQTLVDINGTTQVEKDVKVGNLNVDQQLVATGKVELTSDLTSTNGVTSGKITAASLKVAGATEYAGSLEIAGKAEFTGGTYLGGAQNNFNGDQVTFVKGAKLDHGVTTAKKVVLGDTTSSSDDLKLDIIGNAQLIADVIEGKGNKSIYISVGEESGSSNGETWDSAYGYLTAGRVDLNGGDLMSDPDYGKSASLVAVGSFGNTTDYDETKGNEAGNLNGRIIALRNSIIGIGVSDSDDAAIAQLKSAFNTYFDANGSLDKNNVGAIAYVAKALDVDQSNGSKIIVDAQNSFSSYATAINAGNSYSQNIANNDIYLGNNSVLAFSDYAALDSFAGSTQRAALHFTDGDASLYAEKDAKIVLVGDGFSSRDYINLFSDTGTDDGILIEGNSVTVETINGLLYFTLNKGEQVNGGTLGLNHTAIDSAFSHASAPVKYSLISYAANDNNWDADTANTETHKLEVLHGSAANGITTTNGEEFSDKNGPVADNNDYVAVPYDDNGTTAYHVYHAAYNYFLDSVVRNSSTGIEAEQAARLSIYGGTAQAALSAGATTYDAISGRMGVGAQNGSITFADNGQGAGLWVSPIYKSHDSDGFGAQGVSYGVDMSMYGLALGGDFTMANGMRFGAAFNVGSGDADGQGVGAGVSNDFDYVGFAVYGGFSMDKFSVIGDISYTMVDNDVKANTSIEQISASMDSTNLSVGVTGQYAFDFNGLSVVPHAGLRYTSVDMDDYTVKGSADIAYYGADSFNVFSIPVGVTVAKEITAGSWTIKPAFDLTLTANMGDDSVNGTVAWAGIENLQTNVESEVVDSFTYGATLGVSAKSGNMSLGFGVNYTGASSADEYGVNANARFVF